MASSGTVVRTYAAIDRAAADRVHHFVAISEHVRERIRRHYERESVVIHPPVEPFEPEAVPPGGFYLAVGQLVVHKYVTVTFCFYKSISLFVVKPLHFAFHNTVNSFSL